MRTARLVNVILVEEGSNQTYFTTAGIEIGSFNSGIHEKPKVELPKPKGGVVKPQTPEEIENEKQRETEKALSQARMRK